MNDFFDLKGNMDEQSFFIYNANEYLALFELIIYATLFLRSTEV